MVTALTLLTLRKMLSGAREVTGVVEELVFSIIIGYSVIGWMFTDLALITFLYSL